jgi:hypothetical protein
MVFWFSRREMQTACMLSESMMIVMIMNVIILQEKYVITF